MIHPVADVVKGSFRVEAVAAEEDQSNAEFGLRNAE